MTTMGLFHPIPSWNVPELILVLLLLAALIPLLDRYRKRREKLKNASQLARFSNFRKELEESRDIKQLGEQALRVTLRELGTTDGCVLLKGDQEECLGHKVVRGLSSRTADLLTADPLCPYFATAAERWGSLMVFSDLQKPEVANAWHRDPLSNGFIGLMKAEGFEAAVLLGLGTQGRCYGALLAGSRKARFLKSQGLRRALVMGNQVSVALESWSAKRTTERHNEQWRVLYRLGLALRETFDFETQIGILRREMKELLGSKDFALSLQSSPQGPLETVVRFEYARELESTLGTPTNVLETQVMRTRSPLLVSEDWRENSSNAVSSGPTMRSWCGVPLALSDGTLGVLAMVDFHSVISKGQLELFQVVAKEATKAFENARTFRREKDRASWLALLNELGQKAATVLNPKELLPGVCRQVRNAFGYEFVHIDILDRDRNELVVEAQEGYEREILGRRIALGENLAGAAAQSGEPMAVDFVGAEAKYLPLQPGVRCGVSVPLKIEDEILGIFSLESRRERAFSAQEVLMVQTVARHIALALRNAQAYQVAFEHAITDGLTGIKTHRYFMEALEREWRRATRSGRGFAVIMLDLDQFKNVNDRYGHGQGDVVLRAAAKVLSDGARQSNVIARYGGDEFSILMPETTSAQAGTFAERMRGNIENDPLLKTHGVTASFGIGTFPEHGPSKEEVLRAADAGMYLAKYQAGNCVRVGLPAPLAMDAAWKQEILEINLASPARKIFLTGPEVFEAHRNRIEEASQKGMEELYLLDAVTSLARAVDFADPYTRDHGQAVSRWAAQIARQLRMSHEDVEEVRLAGVLHDIGKVGIPLEVLSKPARLSPEEYELIKTHSLLGEKLLEILKLDRIRRITPMVRHHHETYDGKGYPNRLKGEDIPLGARILALADAFDTIISDRAYQKRRTYHEAILELHRCRGTHFDPLLVDSFLQAGDLKSLGNNR